MPTRDLLDEIKTKWNIPVTLPMAVPWGKDDVVWLVQEVERLRKEVGDAHAALAVAKEQSPYIWCEKHDWEDVQPCIYCSKEGGKP